MDRKIEIFCCYAHEDKAFLRDLRAQLNLLERQKLVTIWSDADISPGTVQLDEVARHLSTAQIVLLLISPDFMQSNYCYDIMQRSVERLRREKIYIIPVLLRPVDLQGAPIAGFRALPTDNRPVTLWKDKDSAFLDVAKAISSVVEILCSPPPPVRSNLSGTGNINRYTYAPNPGNVNTSTPQSGTGNINMYTHSPNMANVNMRPHAPQGSSFPPSPGTFKPVKDGNAKKKRMRIPLVLALFIIVGIVGGVMYIPQLIHSAGSTTSSNGHSSSQSNNPALSNGTVATSTKSSTATNIPEMLKLRCTACGNPALGIVLDSITIDASNVTTILNLTITNTRTDSCVLGYFSTLQLQDPAGNKHSVQQSNKISVAANGSIKDYENFSSFVPTQGVQYTLDVTFTHYSGCLSSSAGDNIYQNENFTFPASQAVIKATASMEDVAENRSFPCTACGNASLNINLDSITIDNANLTTILNLTITNTRTDSCVLGYFSKLQLQDSAGNGHTVPQNNKISIAPNSSIKDFEDFNSFVPTQGVQYTLEVTFTPSSGCASSSGGENIYQNENFMFSAPPAVAKAPSNTRDVIEKRKLLCTACGDPSLAIVLDSITIDNANLKTILNLTITNTKTDSCVLGYFSRLQMQDPAGNGHRVLQSNRISIAAKNTIKDYEDFSSFVPTQGTQYTLDVTFTHYSGCASSSAGDNIYQNIALTF